MNKYPKYKSSGVEWIGEIPEHWGTTKIKYTSDGSRNSFIDGDWIESKDLSDDGIKYITSGNIGIGSYKEQGSGFISEDTFKDLNCTELFQGDLIISRLFIPVGRSCILPNLNKRVVTCVDNVILRPKNNFDKHYLNYQFNSNKYSEHTELISRGVTLTRISRGMLGNVSIVTPPLPEQQQIVQFLDEKTEVIDKLISTKERKIELLKQQRTSLINEVITKGLNSKVKMKDSGVEWIGEIPEHWMIIKLKHVFKYKKGYPFKSEDMGDEGIPIVKVTDIKNLSINIPKDYFTKEVDNRITRMKEGDIVITTVGSKMEVSNSSVGQLGKVGKYHDGFLLNQNTLCIRLKDKDRNIDYIYYQLQTNNFRSHLDIHSHGTVNQSSLNVEDVLNFTILIPQLNEQNEIVEYLDTRTKEIDDLVSMEQNKIDLLKEYRQSLISEVITGKIDVRTNPN